MNRTKNSMLSVIIPIYNIEQCLPKCIESVINQTYKNLEIILVDDGSTDGCGDLCDHYSKIDKRVIVLHESNEGLVRARKRGLRKAQGKYIAFVDGDDWIEKSMYEDLINVLEKTKASFVDSGHFLERNNIYSIRKVHSGLHVVNDNKKHQLYMNLLDLDDTAKMYPSIWSKVFKADLIKKCYEKVPDERQYGEDVINLIYCISEAALICQVDKVYYHYIYRGGSISRSKSFDQIEKYYGLWQFCGQLILDIDGLAHSQEIDKMLFHKLRAELIDWNDDADLRIQRYVFPEIEMLFEKKIVVYGAGRVGVDYIAQISKYTKCEIVCWVDKQYKKYHYLYREVMNVDQIICVEFDLVVLAVKDKEIAEDIRKELEEMKIPTNKVLWLKPKKIY